MRTPGSAPHASAVRSWLLQAMQLHPRAMFGNAVEAQKTFAEITAAPGMKRAGRQAVQALVSRRAPVSNRRAS